MPEVSVGQAASRQRAMNRTDAPRCLIDRARGFPYIPASRFSKGGAARAASL